MKAVIVQPAAYGVEAPPIGPAYISAVLKEKGMTCEIFDLNAKLHKDNPEFRRLWDYDSLNEWYDPELFRKNPFSQERIISKTAKEILDSDAGLIGFSVHNSSANFTIKLASKIKEEDKERIIVFGGPICHKNLRITNKTLETDYEIHKYADYLVCGEGENTFLELIKCLERKENPSKCNGLLLKDGEKLVYTGDRTPILNLDSLPFPDYSEFTLDDYSSKKRKLRILSSRGCTNHCTFCTDTNFWFPYRFRSAKSVIDEIKRNIKEYGCEEIEFNDSLMNGNPKLLNEICECMIKERIKIQWEAQVRADRFMNRSMFEKMRKAGCVSLFFGIESGSQKVLNDMKKGINIAEVPSVLAAAKEYGIKVIASFIIGFPTESENDFEETLAFIRKYSNLMDDLTVNMFAVNHLSEVEQNISKYGIIPHPYHRGLWRTIDGKNTPEERMRRLNLLLDEFRRRIRISSIVRQK